MRQIGVSLEDEIIEKLDAEAARRGMTRSQLARLAIEIHVNWRKVFDNSGLVALVEPNTEVEKV
jgi:metal-responsive CopG/Arc/MetJ family transcriptional regulator